MKKLNVLFQQKWRRLVNFDDDILHEFLIHIFKNNFLNDGLLIFLSDHGNVTARMLYIFEDYLKERFLPFLYIILQDNKNKTYIQQYANLIKNQQTFIYAYDIYNTLSSIIYGNENQNLKNKNKYFDTPKSKRGKNILGLIPRKRNCKRLKDFECECK